MVEQYRYACGTAVLELPAGKIDKGESDPEKAAERELREETGYSAKNVKYLGSINTSVAYSEEVIHIFAMTGLTAGRQDLDDDEAINIVEMPFEKACELASGGRLIDAKTVAGLFMAKEQLGMG